MSRRKRNDVKLESLSKEELISKCKRYKHQITSTTKKQHKVKEENEKLRNLCIRLFEEYLESHTWIDADDESIYISEQELDFIQSFKDELTSLNLKIEKDLTEYTELS